MSSHKIHGTDLEWKPVFQYPLCQTLNFTEIVDFDEYTPIEVQIYLGRIENLGVNLHFIDKNKVLTRSLLSNYLSYDGPSIAISDLIIDGSKQIQVILKMSQDINTEGNEESKCKNYPYDNYLNYNTCDESYVQNIMKEKLNITPFWATQDMDSITKIRLVSYFFG